MNYSQNWSAGDQKIDGAQRRADESADLERRANEIDALAYQYETMLMHGDWQKKTGAGITLEQTIGEALADDDELYALALRCMQHCLQHSSGFLSTGRLESLMRKHLATEAYRLAEIEHNAPEEYEPV